MNKSAREASDTHDEEAGRASQPPPALAANVRRLRARRGLSSAQLATAAGLPVATVEQLESGEAEPTIKTLWSLATALGVPFSALIAPESAAEASERPSTDVRSRRVLSAKEGGRSSDIYELHIAAGATQIAAARGPGAQENVLVTKGAAVVSAGGKQLTLQTGESASFAADRERAYTSAGGDTTLYIVVSQPAN